MFGATSQVETLYASHIRYASEVARTSPEPVSPISVAHNEREVLRFRQPDATIRTDWCAPPQPGNTALQFSFGAAPAQESNEPSACSIHLILVLYPLSLMMNLLSPPGTSLLILSMSSHTRSLFTRSAKPSTCSAIVINAGRCLQGMGHLARALGSRQVEVKCVSALQRADSRA